MTLPIRETSWGTPDSAYRTAVQRGAKAIAFLRGYLDALYADCARVGIRADILVAQWDLETDSGTSSYWTRDGNPAGLAAFDDGSSWGLTFTPEKAARAQVVHMCRYTGVAVPDGWQAADARWDAAARYAGTVTTTADLGDGRWATDRNYGSKIEQRHAAYSFTPPKEDTDMAGSTITWPGLPGGPITFSFPFHLMIVPASRTLQRPGIKARHPRHSVQHSNGNPAALARQDSVYLAGGAGGRQASWHATVDHKEGYANLPADEVGWHAGDGAGPGNYNGFAVELSEYMQYNLGPVEARQGRKNAAEVMGRVMARFDAVSKQHTYNPNYHVNYMDKNCPRVILSNPTWVAEYEQDFWFFFNDEKARMSGTATPSPAPAAGFAKGDHIEVLQPLNIRQGWGTSGRLVTTLTEGTKGVIIDGPQIADGYTWWDIRIDGFGTGFVAEGPASDPFLKRVEAPAPTPPPKVYAPKSPIPELLETNLGFADMYNTAVAVSTVNETDFIFVSDVIEFKRESKARQYAGNSSAEVMEPYGEGDRAIAAWITQIEDGTYWYVLTGGNDEWTRVAVADTVRIADAPLIPTPQDTHITEALTDALTDALD